MQTYTLYKTSYKVTNLLSKYPCLSEDEIRAILIGFYAGSVRSTVKEETSASKYKNYTFKNLNDRLRWLLSTKIIVRTKGKLKDGSRKKYFYYVNPKAKIDFKRNDRSGNVNAYVSL